MALVLSKGTAADGSHKGKKVFFIDRFEVTNRSYFEFLEDTGYQPDDADAEAFLAHWNRAPDKPPRPAEGTDDYPVVFVDHEDALEYARRSGKALPTRQQWLTAALGKIGRQPFPWGDRFMPFYCNSWRSGIGGTARVGTFEYGRSEWGCYDMVGNVAEWTDTLRSEVVEPTYHIMGGSWTDGGYPGVEEAIFDLLKWIASAESRSRNNTLGFRCVRNDALDYIRERIVPVLGKSSKEKSALTLEELSGILDPLYEVLKLFEFESRIVKSLSLPSSLSLISLLEDDKPNLLYCFNNGTIRSTTLEGDVLWDYEEEEPDISYRYMSIPKEGAFPERIILHGWSRSLLRVIDAVSGRPLWHIGERGSVRHLMTVPGNQKTGRKLLVDWYLEDRFTHGFSVASRFQDEIVRMIELAAQRLLTGGFLLSPFREDRLSFFMDDVDALEIEADSKFCVNHFGPEALLLDWEMKNRFHIQLNHGEFSIIEIQNAPGNRLVLYDLETGKVCWSTDFPGALFDFNGVMRQEPLLLNQGERIAVVLEDQGLNSQRSAQSCVCTIDGHDGSIRTLAALKPNEKLLGLVPSSDARFLIAGISSSGEFLLFEESSSQRQPVLRFSMAQLIEQAGTIQPINNVTKPLGLMPGDHGVSRGDGSIRPLDLWVCPETKDLWLVVETERGDTCYLLTNYREGRFSKIFELQGVFSHHVCLSIPQKSVSGPYIWIWDDSGFLIAFDGEKGEYLWSKELGNISDLSPVFSDLDGDGYLEGVVTSLSGDLKALDLATGRTILDLKGRELSFSFLLPADVDQDHKQEFLVGLSEGDGFILEGVTEQDKGWDRALGNCLQAIDAWNTREPVQ
ncbi:MAG: SUMF1/EgtB/PvdO family nonheme iron enzyme [Planctomycetes bacterium]|nr:SUMF1/EgtB/PvdO family nonheme iron enzyme [Planctomycetota bacterium]